LAVTRTSAGTSHGIPLPPTWEAYLAALSSSHRYYVKRSLRDFDKWAGSFEVRNAASLAEMQEGLKVLADLHTQRWRQAGEDGRFASPRFRAFHEALLPLLQVEQAVELLWLCVRGEPVAAQYNFVWDGKVYFYQSGRKPDLPEGIRPGVVLHAHAIRRAIEAGRREYDFLAGPERYKQQLALASRPLVDLRAARPSLREQARQLLEEGVSSARRLQGWWRQVFNLPSHPAS
jgi:CelD/BcsL family acetyltransferase involved in cellulose biosynthesis